MQIHTSMLILIILFLPVFFLFSLSLSLSLSLLFCAFLLIFVNLWILVSFFLLLLNVVGFCFRIRLLDRGITFYKPFDVSQIILAVVSC